MHATTPAFCILLHVSQPLLQPNATQGSAITPRHVMPRHTPPHPRHATLHHATHSGSCLSVAACTRILDGWCRLAVASLAIPTMSSVCGGSIVNICPLMRMPSQVVYLNDVAKGGETFFHRQQCAVTPRTGLSHDSGSAIAD